MEEYDVLIIGAGVAGAFTARELSRYQVRVLVVERNHGVGLETTSTNMALVCQGGDALTFRPGTLHAELNVKSIPLWPKIAEELNIPFRRVGGLGLIRDKADFKRFTKMVSRAFRSSTEPNAPYYIPEGSFEPLEMVDKRRLRDLEPNVNPNVVGAVYDPNLAVTDPVKLTQALAENAHANGVEFRLGVEVEAIERASDGSFLVRAGGETIRARFIVNSAGVDADRVADMVPGARDFSYVPMKGVLTDFDREAGEQVKHQLYYLPRPGEPHVKTLVPTIDGGLRAGIYLEYTYRSDREVTAQAIEYNLGIAREIIPNFPFEKHVTRSFAGVMPFTNPETGWHEYIVDIPEHLPNWVNIVLGPAGVSASPMVARRVVELLSISGLILEPNPRFSPSSRKPLEG